MRYVAGVERRLGRAVWPLSLAGQRLLRDASATTEAWMQVTASSWPMLGAVFKIYIGFIWNLFGFIWIYMVLSACCGPLWTVNLVEISFRVAFS